MRIFLVLTFSYLWTFDAFGASKVEKKLLDLVKADRGIIRELDILALHYREAKTSMKVYFSGPMAFEFLLKIYNKDRPALQLLPYSLSVGLPNHHLPDILPMDSPEEFIIVRPDSGFALRSLEAFCVTVSEKGEILNVEINKRIENSLKKSKFFSIGDLTSVAHLGDLFYGKPYTERDFLDPKFNFERLKKEIHLEDLDFDIVRQAIEFTISDQMVSLIYLQFSGIEIPGFNEYFLDKTIQDFIHRNMGSVQSCLQEVRESLNDSHKFQKFLLDSGLINISDSVSDRLPKIINQKGLYSLMRSRSVLNQDSTGKWRQNNGLPNPFLNYVGKKISEVPKSILRSAGLGEELFVYYYTNEHGQYESIMDLDFSDVYQENHSHWGVGVHTSPHFKVEHNETLYLVLQLNEWATIGEDINIFNRLDGYLFILDNKKAVINIHNQLPIEFGSKLFERYLDEGNIHFAVRLLRFYSGTDYFDLGLIPYLQINSIVQLAYCIFTGTFDKCSQSPGFQNWYRSVKEHPEYLTASEIKAINYLADNYDHQLKEYSLRGPFKSFSVTGFERTDQVVGLFNLLGSKANDDFFDLRIKNFEKEIQIFEKKLNQLSVFQRIRDFNNWFLTVGILAERFDQRYLDSDHFDELTDAFEKRILNRIFELWEQQEKEILNLWVKDPHALENLATELAILSRNERILEELESQSIWHNHLGSSLRRMGWGNSKKFISIFSGINTLFRMTLELASRPKIDRSEFGLKFKNLFGTPVSDTILPVNLDQIERGPLVEIGRDLYQLTRLKETICPNDGPRACVPMSTQDLEGVEDRFHFPLARIIALRNDLEDFGSGLKKVTQELREVIRLRTIERSNYEIKGCFSAMDWFIK